MLDKEFWFEINDFLESRTIYLPNFRICRKILKIRRANFKIGGEGGTMKYHRVLGSTGLNDRSRLTGETTEPRWMERMREVLNEFMRFMNPHLRLCFISIHIFLVSSESNRSFLTKEEKEEYSIEYETWQICDDSRLIVSLFGEGKDHSLKSRG